MTNHHVMMSGKIHRATVTVADLDYEDSISIDTQLLQLAKHCCRRAGFNLHRVHGGASRTLRNH